MARKPIHIEAAGKATPRDRVWAAIRRLKKFTAYEASRRADVRDETAETYLQALIKGGFIQAVSKASRDPGQPSRYKETTFELIRDVGIEAPRLDRQGNTVRQGLGTLALWRAMRINKGTFNYREIQHTAICAGVEIAAHTAQTYCQLLAKAGYLSIAVPSKPGTPARYRLVKYTGPKAPMVQRVKHIYDPNLGEVTWHPEVHA